METKHQRNTLSQQQKHELADALRHRAYQRTAGLSKYIPNILNIIDTLSDEECTIIRERLINDKTFPKIGEAMGVQFDHVHGVYEKAIRIILKLSYEDAYKCMAKYTGIGTPDPELLAIHVKSLGFSTRVDNCLTSAIGGNDGYITLEKLLKFNPARLIRINRCGANSVREIITLMCAEGFTEWATSYDTWVKRMWPDEAHMLLEITDTEPPYKVGDLVRFGKYRQDIYSWYVLDIQDNKALLISDTIIVRRHFYGKTGSTWAGSAIRRFLNDEFYKRFDEKQRERIVETRVINSGNPWYGTKGSEGTTDSFFLLSIDEVIRYFGDSSKLPERPHSEDGVNDQDNNIHVANTAWWLCSLGKDDKHVACVDDKGRLYIHGYKGTRSGVGVRPALWVQM